MTSIIMMELMRSSKMIDNVQLELILWDLKFGYLSYISWKKKASYWHTTYHNLCGNFHHCPEYKLHLYSNHLPCPQDQNYFMVLSNKQVSWCVTTIKKTFCKQNSFKHLSKKWKHILQLKLSLKHPFPIDFARWDTLIKIIVFSLMIWYGYIHVASYLHNKHDRQCTKLQHRYTDCQLYISKWPGTPEGTGLHQRVPG